MTYNLVKIGKRLRNERKKAGFSSREKLSDEIAEYVGVYNRQRIGKWEDGKELPPMEVLCTLCNLYNCDIGYLLCEYDCKTRPVEDISKKTGLSDAAINKLSNMKQFQDGKTDALNALLEDSNFDWVLYYIGKYQETIREYQEALQKKREDIPKIVSEFSGKEKSTPESREKRKQIDDRLHEADLQWDAMAYRIDTEFRRVIDDIKNETSRNAKRTESK